MKYGPIDVVVLGMVEPRFEGAILSELEKLANSGTIRVLDAMVLVKDAEGNVKGLDIEDLAPDDAKVLGFIDTGTRGLFDADDSADLAEGMVARSAVVALAIENAWAVPLMNAFMEAGADLALHTRVPAVVADEALAALSAGKE